MNSVIRGITYVIKTKKTPLKVIEEKYGKEHIVGSDKEIIKYLNQKGYKSLSKLIEAK